VHAHDARLAQSAVATRDRLLGSSEHLGDTPEWGTSVEPQRLEQLLVQAVEPDGFIADHGHQWRKSTQYSSPLALCVGGSHPHGVPVDQSTQGATMHPDLIRALAIEHQRSMLEAAGRLSPQRQPSPSSRRRSKPHREPFATRIAAALRESTV
jgi:hypothetical protein